MILSITGGVFVQRNPRDSRVGSNEVNRWKESSDLWCIISDLPVGKRKRNKLEDYDNVTKQHRHKQFRVFRVTVSRDERLFFRPLIENLHRQASPINTAPAPRCSPKWAHFPILFLGVFQSHIIYKRTRSANCVVLVFVSTTGSYIRWHSQQKLWTVSSIA